MQYTVGTVKAVLGVATLALKRVENRWNYVLLSAHHTHTHSYI